MKEKFEKIVEDVTRDIRDLTPEQIRAEVSAIPKPDRRSGGGEPEAEQVTCSLCGKGIETGEDGVCISFGWWKSAGVTKDPDFDPTGEEFDCCQNCRTVFTALVGWMVFK